MVLFVLTVGVLSLLIFALSKNIMEEKTNQYIEDVLFQAKKQIEFNIERVVEMAQGLCVNVKGVQEPVRIANKGYANEAQARSIEQTLENAIFFAIMQKSEIELATIITDQGEEFIINKKGVPYPLEKVDKVEVYAAKGSIIWYPPTKELPFLTTASAVNDLVTQKPIGYLITCVNPEYFLSIFNNMQLAQGEEAFLVNVEGRIILHNGFDEDLPPNSLGLDNFAGKGFAAIHYRGRNCYVAYLQIENTPWSLVSVLPASEFEKSAKVLFNGVMIVAVFVMMVDGLLSFIIARSVTRPIRELIPALEKIGGGDFTTQVKENSGDEIGMLARTINQMTTSIRELIDLVYRAQILRQQSELKALRMQISPHFLYNTLDSINWLARARGMNDIGQMTKALADLMRATVGGSDFITVREEINIIQSYLSIQKIRYESRLVAEVSIQDELFELHMPKLIVQPILENAFVHGIDDKIGVGHITISGILENGILIFEIRDDGAGMSREKKEELRSLASQKQSDSSEHIGVANVDKRLKLYYGDEYGITIESEVNVGTCVRITFPQQTSMELKFQMKGQESNE